MKINNLFKLIPFLSTLIILMIIFISNQKDYTKLKILFWNTPSLSLGTYLTISTGTGFFFSYIITSKLGRNNQSNVKNELRTKFTNVNDDSNEVIDSNTNISYNNIMIERDIKDPLPTINASFRIIGKNTRKNKFAKNNSQQEYENSFPHEESDDSNYKEDNNFNNVTEIKNKSNDWNDYSYSNW